MRTKIITRLLFTILTTSFPAISYAQHRSSKDAYDIAENYFCKQFGETHPTRARNRDNGTGSQQVSYQPYYIFNDTLSQAFVIVAGDERMKTILGTSTTHTFDANSIPCGLSWLLEHYEEQYSSLEQSTSVTGITKSDKTRAPEKSIGPLLSAEWEQSYSPYNDNSPKGCPAGCVATAMGQIMYHFKYPETGSGSFSYTSRTNKYRLSFNFGNAHFNWSAMQDSYSTSNYGTAESRKAVADLLEACGVSVAMDYDASKGSGAYEADVPYAIKNFFNYNENAVVYEREYYKNSEWYEKVYEELTANRPVFYGGVSKTGGRDAGHAFVIDGYRNEDGKFHVNWGWGGRYNGYYELDALDPPNGYRFSSGQCMLARFCPETVGMHEDIFYAEDFTTSDEIKIDKDMTFRLTGVVNYSNSCSYVVPDVYFSGMIGVGLFDSDFKFVSSLSEESIHNRTYNVLASLNLTVRIPSGVLEKDKQYHIAPYIRHNTSENPTRIRTIGGMTDYFSITGSGAVKPDDDKPAEKIVMLNENFDSMSMPKNWSQENISGQGIWETKIVLVGNDNSDTPRPASGAGYTCLEYNSGLSIGTRTITKLVTPVMSGDDSSQFMVSCQYRSFTAQVGNKNILTVLIDRGCNGEWEVLTEQAVLNQNMWLQMQLPYTSTDTYRIAIEGSVDYSGILFLDDFRISQVETSHDGSAEHPFTPTQANAYGSTLSSNEISEHEYYIKGKVASIKEQFGTQYGNATFYISEDGTANNQFFIYRANYIGNKKYAGESLILNVGDDVIVCGKITNYQGTLPETVQNLAYVVSINGISTGMSSTMTDIKKFAPVYDLNGRKVERAHKGMYILNKRKIIKQ